MFDVGSFRIFFSKSLSNWNELAGKIYGPSVHRGISVYIINNMNRAKNLMMCVTIYQRTWVPAPGDQEAAPTSSPTVITPF
jgi:hypothetical protein